MNNFELIRTVESDDLYYTLKTDRDKYFLCFDSDGFFYARNINGVPSYYFHIFSKVLTNKNDHIVYIVEDLISSLNINDDPSDSKFPIDHDRLFSGNSLYELIENVEGCLRYNEANLFRFSICSLMVSKDKHPWLLSSKKDILNSKYKFNDMSNLFNKLLMDISNMYPESMIIMDANSLKAYRKRKLMRGKESDFKLIGKSISSTSYIFSTSYNKISIREFNKMMKISKNSTYGLMNKGY